MYMQDSLQRMNQEAVDKHYEAIGAQAEKINNDESWARAVEQGEEDVIICDYCDKPAVHTLPVYNPADALREPPVEGAYAVYDVCEECYDNGTGMEELFYCEGCGKLHVIAHSWDVLAVTIDGELFCQACAAENLQPTSLGQLYMDLSEGAVRDWPRIDRIPGKELLWEDGFSQYSDFPGHTSLASVLTAIQEAAEEAGLDLDTDVYPIVSMTHQFAVSLAVYY